MQSSAVAVVRLCSATPRVRSGRGYNSEAICRLCETTSPVTTKRSVQPETERATEIPAPRPLEMVLELRRAVPLLSAAEFQTANEKRKTKQFQSCNANSPLFHRILKQRPIQQCREIPSHLIGHHRKCGNTRLRQQMHCAPFPLPCVTALACADFHLTTLNAYE